MFEFEEREKIKENIYFSFEGLLRSSTHLTPEYRPDTDVFTYGDPNVFMQEELKSAEHITVLEGLEPVRKRPGMYIGSTSETRLHHLVWEVVDNSVDDVMAGFANKIGVLIQKDGGVSVADNGRGIPVDVHKQTKKSALETVLTVLHAGGKFGGEASGSPTASTSAIPRSRRSAGSWRKRSR